MLYSTTLLIFIFCFSLFTYVFSVSKKTTFLIFTTFESSYKAEYAHYIQAIEDYAHKHGYLYHHDFDFRRFFLRDEKAEAHYYRIEAARQLFWGISTTKQADWIVYIDIDAYFVEDSLPLEALVDGSRLLEGNKGSVGCEMIAQDYPHIVNSGFLLLKNSTFSKLLIQNWLLECEKAKNYPMKWTWDQGPLQNVILTVRSSSPSIASSYL